MPPNGTMSASVIRSAQAVEASSAPLTRLITSFRDAAAMMAVPPMLCPASTAFPPPGSVCSSTAGTALVVHDDAQVAAQRADHRCPERDRAGVAVDEDHGGLPGVLRAVHLHVQLDTVAGDHPHAAGGRWWRVAALMNRVQDSASAGMTVDSARSMRQIGR